MESESSMGDEIAVCAWIGPATAETEKKHWGSHYYFEAISSSRPQASTMHGEKITSSMFSISRILLIFMDLIGQEMRVKHLKPHP
jgi:hypothetical protein